MLALGVLAAALVAAPAGAGDAPGYQRLRKEGAYVLSDSQSFDPSTTLRGQWTELEPVTPSGH